MLSKTSKLTAAFLVALVGAGVSSAPRPASADSTSTAILAGLAGLVVGSLLFDSSRHQYYYNTGGRRNYVSDSWAQSYYQKKDPSYFNSHRGTFQQNHAAFANKWNQDHGKGGGHSGGHGH
jgi:hypothetical protein